jgi:hypothetical protein
MGRRGYETGLFGLNTCDTPRYGDEHAGRGHKSNRVAEGLARGAASAR